MICCLLHSGRGEPDPPSHPKRQLPQVAPLRHLRLPLTVISLFSLTSFSSVYLVGNKLWHFPRKWLKWNIANGNKNVVVIVVATATVAVAVCCLLLLLIGLTLVVVISCCGRQRRVFWFQFWLTSTTTTVTMFGQTAIEIHSTFSARCVGREGWRRVYPTGAGAASGGQKPNKFKTAIGQIGWMISQAVSQSVRQSVSLAVSQAGRQSVD